VINWRSLSVTWSLAVEEQFYLAWPLLCWKTSKHILGWVCIGLLIQAPITRLILVHAGWDALRIRHLPFCCVDGLAAGALLALWIDSPAASTEKMKWMSLLSLGVGALMFWRLSTLPELSVAWAFSYSFLAIGFCGLVGMSLLRSSQAATFSPVVYLGKISYGLYLYHPLAIAILVRTMHRPSLVPYAALVLTIIMAALSFQFFESIFLALKEKLAPAP
jgi:peptidoglycan/LPS O-acetylase OafA/YrhL